MTRAKYLVILAIVVLFSTCSFSTNRTKSEKLPKRKGTVKTIYSSHGEIIDCVNFYEQPAFDHPRLKDKKYEHKQEIPESLRNISSQSSGFKNSSTFHTWHWSRKCPKGTVPILRQPNNNYNILRKRKKFTGQTTDNDDRDKHEYAMVEVDTHYYYGASGVFNVWKPFVEENEMSLAQMWVVNDEGPLETIEVGWHVHPNNYNGNVNEPRLFIYWTADDYEHTGCYNLECPGFIYFGHSKWILGGQLAYSEIDNGQIDIDINVARNPRTGNWCLRIGTDFVGYWPAALFENLIHRANNVQWGGEIYNNNGNEEIHTSTEMGSGCFANQGVGKAAYVYSMKTIQESGGRFVNQRLEKTFVSHPYTLQVNQYGNPLPGYSFFYGGPGRI